jgi:hypothetical protein
MIHGNVDGRRGTVGQRAIQEDPAEGLLASALSYRANGVCPVPPSGMQPAPTLEAKAQMALSAHGNVIKPFWRQNRIYRLPTAR